MCIDGFQMPIKCPTFGGQMHNQRQLYSGPFTLREAASFINLSYFAHSYTEHRPADTSLSKVKPCYVETIKSGGGGAFNTHSLIPISCHTSTSHTPSTIEPLCHISTSHTPHNRAPLSHIHLSPTRTVTHTFFFFFLFFRVVEETKMAYTKKDIPRQ